MRPSHLILILLGWATQAMGWALLPRRWKAPGALAALAMDMAWILWYANDHRGLSVSGVWALSPVATWLSAHLILGPVLGVEVLARLLPWRRWIRLVGLGFILVGYAWGLGEAYGPPVLTETSLTFPDLPPAFEGYRIILIGDIHAGPYAGTRTVGRWARAIQKVPGDLLVGAGDFIAHIPEEAERTGEAFKILHPVDGLVGVFGNHDQYSHTDEVAERLRRHGWTMLLDQGLVIERQGQRLMLLGSRFTEGDPASFQPDWQGKPWPEGFRIGLCHDPDQWPVLQKEGARLTLAAHTHGGQVDLSPLYNAAKERSPYLEGLYEEGADRLFVTRGLGCTSLPFRFRCRPEIVRITLHRGN
jgi:hypothetical protein